ncbi:MAG TPA: energy-coupling factor transporter transmembrane protein EcfT [Candidatus Lumbricidophila sp.]|nr:energy-coupling factor transporter transmembrane protein EcfT [Candidatus Lumbricidophila sp.]
MIGLYSPGRSLIHRMSAGWKLTALVALVAIASIVPGWWAAGVVGMLTIAALATARPPFGLLWVQLVPLLWLLALAVPLQIWFSGWLSAALMALRLLIAVTLAAVYTLTTPVAATLDAMQAALRPFRRWVDPDRIGLAVALTIRCVPLLGELCRDVLEARRARGASGSPLAFAVPVVIRTLRTADAIGEALVARGVDD